MEPLFSCRYHYILSRCIDMNSRKHSGKEREGNIATVLSAHTLSRLKNTPIQNALVYISFCVARKKSDNRVLGHDSID